MNKPIQGYVRSNVPLATAVHKSTSDPSVGILEISTDDGVLRLMINTDTARNLQIDLNQFIGEDQSAGWPVTPLNDGTIIAEVA